MLRVNYESSLSHWLQSWGMFEWPDVNLALLTKRSFWKLWSRIRYSSDCTDPWHWELKVKSLSRVSPVWEKALACCHKPRVFSTLLSRLALTAAVDLVLYLFGTYALLRQCIYSSLIECLMKHLLAHKNTHTCAGSCKCQWKWAEPLVMSLYVALIWRKSSTVTLTLPDVQVESKSG